MSLPKGHWKETMRMRPGWNREAERLRISDWWMDRFNVAWMVALCVLLACAVWDLS